MAGELAYRNLPFKDAIAFFKQKVNVPTERWTDIWKGMHARAFVVAGAAKADLLADLRKAVDEAIQQGKTIEQFRSGPEGFDAILEKHGWAKTIRGGVPWRAKVILETNIRTAYAAGRYQQMREVTERRPYWEYRHGDSIQPRPEHVAWDRTVLRHDDPWWDKHYPPNGWGCSCKVFALSEDDLEAEGKTGPDPAPKDKPDPDGKRDPKTGEVMPAGIDPGWDYNVGEAAWGRKISDQAMAEWRKEGRDAWERLPGTDWQEAGRPEEIPLEPTKAGLQPEAADKPAFRRRLERVLGGDEKIFQVGDAQTGSVPVLVNAEAVAEHTQLQRSVYADLLPELLEEPYEVWIAFERHKGTGRYALRAHVIKGAEVGGKPVMLSATASKGNLETWSYLATRDRKSLNKERSGMLIFAK